MTPMNRTLRSILKATNSGECDSYRRFGMRKPRPRGRKEMGTRSRDLFPPSWPVCAWYHFEQDLLAAVYLRSADLWHVLREACHRVSGSLRHLEYEGDIESQGALGAATALIPRWTGAEVKLHQA